MLKLQSHIAPLSPQLPSIFGRSFYWTYNSNGFVWYLFGLLKVSFLSTSLSSSLLPFHVLTFRVVHRIIWEGQADCRNHHFSMQLPLLLTPEPHFLTQSIILVSLLIPHDFPIFLWGLWSGKEQGQTKALESWHLLQENIGS